MQRGPEEGGDICKAENKVHVFEHTNMRLYVSVTCRNDSQEKMGALEAQVKQLGLQAAQDRERLARDRTLSLQLLHKVSLGKCQYMQAYV